MTTAQLVKRQIITKRNHMHVFGVDALCEHQMGRQTIVFTCRRRQNEQPRDMHFFFFLPSFAFITVRSVHFEVLNSIVTYTYTYPWLFQGGAGEQVFVGQPPHHVSVQRQNCSRLGHCCRGWGCQLQRIQGALWMGEFMVEHEIIIMKHK